MKKSKFLKKSLAMLLALMLVVAMIPLSASAAGALPNLTRLYIDNIDVALDADGKTFKADIDQDATTVKLRADALALSTEEGDATLEVYKDTASTGYPLKANNKPAGNETITLKDWGTESDGVVTLKLRVISADKTQKAEYVVELTRTTDGVSADLKSAEPVTGAYKVDVNNASRVVTVLAARDALKTGVQFTVTPDDGAKVSVGTGATVSGNTITVTADKQTFFVTSESNKNKVEWTVEVTEVDGLISFSMGDYEGVITDKNDDGTDDTVTVTLPKSAAQDSLGYPLTNTRLPVSFVVYGNSSTIHLTNSSDGKPNGAKDDVTPKSGDVVDFGTLLDSNNAPNTASNDYLSTSAPKLKVSCVGISDVQSYDLVIKFEQSADSTISFAQLDGEIATIDGNKITAVLPQYKADGSTPTLLSSVEVQLYTDTTVQKVSGFTPAQGADQNVDGKTRWYYGSSASAIDTMNLEKPQTITVQAQNGSTSQYTISATIDTNTKEAYLSSMSLKAGSTEYKGEIVDHTITFTVPYMTIDASKWKVYAAANESAKIVSGSNPVVSGYTTLDDITPVTSATFTDFNSLVTTKDTNKGTIKAVNKNNDDVFTEYTIVINLEDPALGKTLNSLEFSAQTTAPDKNDKVTARVNTANTVVGTVSSKSLEENNTGTITIKPPYSLSKDNTAVTVYNIVNKFATNNGGVAYLGQWDNDNSKFDNVEKLVALPNDKSNFSGNDVTAGTFGATFETDNDYYIIVLPEDTAREIDKDIISGTKVIEATDWKAGTRYTVIEDPQNASAVNTLSEMYVGSTPLSLSDTEETISGTLPWSSTAADGTTAAEIKKATFVTYETANPYAVLTMNGTTAQRFYSDGDSDGDGYADGDSATNRKLLFVRDTDHKVTVYVYNYSDQKYQVLNNNSLTILAEDGQSKKTYTFNLNWADPNTEATISSFKVGNSTGTISSDRKISVTVPYGTDLKGLIPTFTASSGASVAIEGGATLISGKTAVNFSHAVKLIVTSEDGKETMDYTVTVTVADQFTDVQPGDWFYENVMRAVELGIAKGKGNGIFDPYGKITRRDFAIMLAQAMGQSNDGEAVSPFPDVEDDDYGVVSIKYLYDQEITVGDSNGNFNPDANITRQEVAIMMAKAFGATGTTDEVFTDDAKIASWAKSYVYAAKAAGLMNGDVDGSFRPNDSFTRAEAASAMVNAIDK